MSHGYMAFIVTVVKLARQLLRRLVSGIGTGIDGRDAAKRDSLEK